MFSWFRSKTAPRSVDIPPIFNQTIYPVALSSALAENFSQYVKDIESGKKSMPAHKRKDGSLYDVWSDTRLEALSPLLLYGASDVSMLADFRQQKKLLDSFYKEKPQYKCPHEPTGDPVHDTLQALFQVYLTLKEIGSAVCDEETESISLLDEHAKTLWESWTFFDQAVHRSDKAIPMPSTLFEMVFNDVTKKAKTIALSATFGPDYHRGMQHWATKTREIMQKQGISEDIISKEVQRTQLIMRKVLAADKPDDLA
jgi:hypothetical protein